MGLPYFHLPHFEKISEPVYEMHKNVCLKSLWMDINNVISVTNRLSFIASFITFIQSIKAYKETYETSK